MSKTFTRRRFLCLSAASVLTGRAEAAQIQRRRFFALGAEAEIVLPGGAADADRAEAAIKAEIQRIEAAFSLWDPGSELSRLNRDGVIEAPSTRFQALAARARDMSEKTQGAFDVTIQPLWEAARQGQRAPGPVGYRDLVVTPSRATFLRPGMGASFNGIAQGFATDRSVEILRAHGYGDILANLGEYRGLGIHPEGRPWAIGVPDPRSGEIVQVLDPARGAIATSEPLGTLVGDQSHIFDPLGRSGPRWRSVTIQASDAATADALSTAVAASPVDEAAGLLRRGGALRAVLISEAASPVIWTPKT